MKKVYDSGDWAIQIGPVHVKTSHHHAAKGLDQGGWGGR
jgi:hypothetical protein